MSAKLTAPELGAIKVVQFSEKFAPLFQPHTYKICYGGRDGKKSWSIARALLIIGAHRLLRILCTREIQKSLKDSVHQLLTDQIMSIGLGGFYEVLANEIRGRNGTLFLFAGLSDQTAESVKSFEGVDICWIEEARNITKRSLDILIPTIRKDGSEIWISFNPELDSDEVYQRFVTHPPKNAVVIRTTFSDFPLDWSSDKSRQDRAHSLATDPEEYRNVWLGECRPTVAGAIYTGEVALAYKEQRICRVTYDPKLKVHAVWDLGNRDYMSIGLFQKGFADYRMIGLIHDHQRKIETYAAQLNALNLNWGWDWLPHDGFIEDYKAPSAYSILKAHGRRVRPKVNTQLPVPNVEIEVGIKAFRGVWHRLIIDEVACAPFIEAAKRYRRSINKQTNTPGPPVHDVGISDLMDMGRYFGLIHEKMTNDEELRRPPPRPQPRRIDPGTGML